jgi:transglutaminase-like putative cysteine protease
MRAVIRLACCLSLVAGVRAPLLPAASAQIKASAPEAAADSPYACRLGPATVYRYQVGATVTARGPTQNVRLMVALPWECAEQQIELVEEDVAPEARTDERKLATGEANQLLIHIPQMVGGQKAHALYTFEVTAHTLLPPEQTDTLVIPAKPDRELKQYLGRSPYIETDHRDIREALEEAWQTLEPASAGDEATDEAANQQDASPEADDEPPTGSPSDTPAADDDADAVTDWRRVEAIYDYIIDRITYEEGEDQSSVQVLKIGKGDCQAIGALFVAMCRTAKVPARLVWVHGHQHAEFYLEDETGVGRWYPIETAGQRAFGEMPVARVILQKGDNFRVPERRRERLRYASDYALFLSTAGTKPSIKYVRNLQ